MTVFPSVLQLGLLAHCWGTLLLQTYEAEDLLAAHIYKAELFFFELNRFAVGAWLQA